MRFTGKDDEDPLPPNGNNSRLPAWIKRQPTERLQAHIDEQQGTPVARRKMADELRGRMVAGRAAARKQRGQPDHAKKKGGRRRRRGRKKGDS